MKKFVFTIGVLFAVIFLFTLSVFAVHDGYETDGICDGNIYSIVRDGSTVAAFDVDNGAVSAGTHVSLYQYYPENPWQRWRFIYLGNGEYKIKDEHSNKFLTVENNSSADGAYMCIYIGSNWDGQIFSIVKNSDGTYAILTKSSNYQMAVTADASGGAIKQQTYTGQSYQHYRLALSGYIYQFQYKYIYADDDLGQYVTVYKTLDVTGDGHASGNNVVQYDRYPGCRWQKWEPVYMGNGDYRIKAMNSGMFLTAAGINTNDNIYVATSTGMDNQLFRILQNNDGTYTFLSKLSNYTKAVSAYGGSRANDVSIVLSSYEGAPANRQRIYPVIAGDSEITNGIYYFKCTNTAKYAQLDDGNSTHLEQHDYNGTLNQQWRVEYVRNNLYKIINVQSGKALTAPTSLSSGQNLGTETYTGSTRQEWYFILLQNGDYEIRCNYWQQQGNTTLVMAVGSAMFNLNLNGTNIRQQTRSGTSRGQWGIKGGYDLSLLLLPEFSSYAQHFNEVETKFQQKNMHNVYSSYSALASDLFEHDFPIHVATSQIIEISTHGNATNLQWESYSNSAWTRDSVLALQSNALSNCRLVLLNACGCGAGGAYGTNIATAIRNRGAKTVVAFEETIYSPYAEVWFEYFYDYYLGHIDTPHSIDESMSLATYALGTDADTFGLDSAVRMGNNSYFWL